MRIDRSDRELVIGFAALCVALLILFAVAGAGIGIFRMLAGF
jgi:hypothetical protein